MPMDPAASWVLLVWYRDDGAGLLTDFKDGDIFDIRPGAVTVGNDEKLDWLCIRIPIPPNGAQLLESGEWVRSQWEPGPTADENIVARKRLYAVPNWRTKFSASDITRIVGRQGLPDGPNVVNGIVENLFMAENVHPK